MKYTITILTLLAGLLIFSACSDSILSSTEADLTIEEFNSEAEKRAPSTGKQTIADIVVESDAANDAESTLLLAALEYT